MSGPSFTRKQIGVSIALGTGTFGESGATTVNLSGLRVSASIVKAGGAAMGNAQIRVFGMPLTLMNQLSTLGLLITQVRRNTVTVTAGDANGMSTVFTGTINNGWTDFQGAPETVFNIEAYAGSVEAVAPIAPSSFSGGTDVATIMAGLAKTMGLQFENSGVSVQLSNPYLPGTGRQQAESVAKAADINWIIDDGVLAIWPKNTARTGSNPTVSPSTGLVGYPTYDSMGVILKTLFNPAIKYGSSIQVQSSLTPACGTWSVYMLAHELESETPGGQWFTTMKAARPGTVPVA